MVGPIIQQAQTGECNCLHSKSPLFASLLQLLTAFVLIFAVAQMTTLFCIVFRFTTHPGRGMLMRLFISP